MPVYQPDVEDRRIGTGTGAIVYDEKEYPASFPLARWGYQSQRYLTYWSAFTGAWLNELMPLDVGDTGEPALRYPLQINYIKTACMKHSYLVFGEVPSTPGPLAPITVSPRHKPGTDDVDDDARIRADELESFVNRVWVDNDGRALQQEAALLQQPLGGCVFRISLAMEDPDLEYGIRIEEVLPDFFMPVWDTGRPTKLMECWVIYRLPAREAHDRFGYDISNGAGDPLYVEYWSVNEVHITLNNVPVKMVVGGIEFDYNHMKNPFGFVPFYYIPRERAGGFYGLSLVDDVLEEAKEMNARLADISDVIEESAHRETYARNVNISPKGIDIGGSREAINLGQTPPGGESPEVFVIDPPIVNEAMIKHIEYLRAQFGRDVFVPGVAEGEDEGSQRSALTLAFRMQPMTAKTTAVRTYWTVALIQMAKHIAKIAVLKGIGGITQKHLEDIDWGVEWSPMIPRDREAELNEAVLGIQTNMLSPKAGNRKLNLTDDPAQSEREVKEWMQFQNSLAAEAEASKAAANGKVPIQTKTQAVATEMKEPGEQ